MRIKELLQNRKESKKIYKELSKLVKKEFKRVIKIYRDVLKDYCLILQDDDNFEIKIGIFKVHGEWDRIAIYFNQLPLSSYGYEYDTNNHSVIECKLGNIRIDTHHVKTLQKIYDLLIRIDESTELNRVNTYNFTLIFGQENNNE